MNITVTFDDFLSIAAIVVIFARGSRAWVSGPSAGQLRMRHQVEPFVAGRSGGLARRSAAITDRRISRARRARRARADED